MFCGGIGLVLLVAAAVSGNEILLMLGLSFSGMAGMLAALPILEDFAGNYHPLRLLAGSTVGAYGIGGALAWLAAQDTEVGGFTTVMAYYRIDVSALAMAQIVAMAFGVLLLWIVRLSELNTTELKLAAGLAAALRSPSSGRVIVLISVGMALLQVAFLLSGIVGYRSITTTERVDAGALLMVTMSPISPFLTGAFLARGQAGISRLASQLLGIGLSSINVVWFFAQGRVAFLFACVLGLMGYAATKEVNLRKVIFRSVFLFVPLILFVFVASQRIRYFQWVEESQRANVFQALKLSVTEGAKLGDAERTESQINYRMNLAMRPLTLNYPAEIIRLRLDGDAGWVGFEEVINSVLIALPRQIYPDKSGLMLHEHLYAERIGTSGLDNAESIFVAALAGFSYLGLPIFALLMWGLVKGVSGLVLLSRSWLLSVISTVTLIGLAMSGGEGALTNWLVNLRSVALIAPFVMAFEMIFLRQPSPVQAQQPPGGRKMPVVLSKKA